MYTNFTSFVCGTISYDVVFIFINTFWVSFIRFVSDYACNISSLLLLLLLLMLLYFDSLFACLFFVLFLLRLLCALLLAWIWNSYFVQMLRIVCRSRNASLWFACNKCNKNRSRRQCGSRLRSAETRLLESRIPILLKAWVFVSNVWCVLCR